VHVREDRRNGAGLAGRFGSPGGSVKMFDKNLVHAIIGGKDLDCGSAELSVNLVLTRGHGSLLLDFRAVGHSEVECANWGRAMSTGSPDLLSNHSTEPFLQGVCALNVLPQGICSSF
jgi:hypothetical protein